MTPDRETLLKDSFYSRNQLAETGIPAAIRRNKLYADNLSVSQRKKIIDYWKKQLKSISSKYKETQKKETFIKDVKKLIVKMNSKYKDSFAPTKFRFSHAQKSLSVLLKYKWCKGEIPMPPVCPIDRNVLGIMNAPYKHYSWTRLSEDKYIEVYSELSKMANDKGCSIAQMELEWFEEINK